jgi:uncharacterized membrane protein YesL
MFENFFRVEGLFYRVGSKVWGLLVLNLLILLTSLPIITIGASLTAAFSVTTKMIRENNLNIVKNYQQSFKANWQASTVLWLVMLIVGILLFADWYYLLGNNQLFSFPTVGVSVITILWSQCFQVIFFFLARYEIKMKQLLISTVKILLQQPIKCLILFFIFSAPLFVMLLSPYLFVFNLYLSLFIGVSFNLFLRTYLLLMIFNRYETAI